MRFYSREKACKESLSFLWHPKKLRENFKIRLAKARKKWARLEKTKEESNKNTPLRILLEKKRRIRSLVSGLSENQRKTLIFQAKKHQGNLDQAFFFTLEMRLDICLFRANFFPSLPATRQAIRHGFVFVNGRQLKQAFSLLSPGDLVSVDFPKSLLDQFLFRAKNQEFIKRKPLHIEANLKIPSLILLFRPQQIYYPCPPQIT